MKVENFTIEANGFEAKLTTYILDDSNEFAIKRRPMIFICPGGGYVMTSDREAEPLACRFLAMGYHAATLRYSVAPAVYPTQLMQTAQAWKIILQHADEWNIIADKIIILGCSAGAHLAASYGVYGGKTFLREADGIGEEELRPAGMILCYPVITARYPHEGSFKYLFGKEYEDLSPEELDIGSLEKHVDEKTPMTFLWHTFTDEAVPIENTLLFASALAAHKVNTEVHIFSRGSHGLSLANIVTASATGGAVQPECEVWASLAETWLKNNFEFELR